MPLLFIFARFDTLFALIFFTLIIVIIFIFFIFIDAEPPFRRHFAIDITSYYCDVTGARRDARAAPRYYATLISAIAKSAAVAAMRWYTLQEMPLRDYDIAMPALMMLMPLLFSLRAELLPLLFRDIRRHYLALFDITLRGAIDADATMLPIAMLLITLMMLICAIIIIILFLSFADAADEARRQRY